MDDLGVKLGTILGDLRRDLAEKESEMSKYGGKSVSVWVDEITAWGKSKGWDKPQLVRHKGYRSTTGGWAPPGGVKIAEVLAKIALVHTELSEAVEAAREGKYTLWTTADGKPEGFVTELADAVIRIFHIAGLMGLDLENAIITKMAYNEKRAYRHGGKKA